MKIELERIEPTQVIKPLIAKAHTPPYKIHKYFARRPWNVFEQMIKAVSEEGETVLDPFCGGGVTIYESFKSNRKVVGVDINPLSTFIVSNMVKKTENQEELFEALEQIREYIHFLTTDYTSFTKAGQVFPVDWYELTYLVECPDCKLENLLVNEQKIANGKYRCLNLDCKSNEGVKQGFLAKDAERLGYKYLYAVHKYGRKKIVKELDKGDIKKIEQHEEFLRGQLSSKNIILNKSIIPLNWDRQFEDQLEKKGIIYFEDFFTRRNLYINKLLLWKIDSLQKDVTEHNYELLRVMFSNVLKEANIMSFTNDAWQGGKPTTWSKHAYWIPSQFCEVNISTILPGSIDRVLKSLKFNDNNLPTQASVAFEACREDADIRLITGTLATSGLEDESIDAIVTDPPYGSNVQYLELSHFWYYWNQDVYKGRPNFGSEAISNRKKFNGSKSMRDYEKNLTEVYLEAFRVLKEGRYMTLTFNNKDVSAWLALLFSIFRAGFSFYKNGIIFQDGVQNYKQTSHTKNEGSPFGDFIYIFIKKKKDVNVNTWFRDEKEFLDKIDKIFTSHLSLEIEDRNIAKSKMFLDVIPYIENYSKTHLQESSDHKLYSHFNKNYFKKLYI